MVLLTMSWTDADVKKLVEQGNVTVEDGGRPTEPSVLPVDSAHKALLHVQAEGSGPELAFARDYLELRVESGLSLGWAHEPFSIRMTGQTYTPDFIEWDAFGGTNFYEVKGAKKIPSQDRSSAKYRTTAALFECNSVQFFWAKQRKDGTFRPRKLPKQGKRDVHEFLRNKKEL